jgi:hypothetical protein
MSHDAGSIDVQQAANPTNISRGQLAQVEHLSL